MHVSCCENGGAHFVLSDSFRKSSYNEGNIIGKGKLECLW